MQAVVAGSGKLANELLGSLQRNLSLRVVAWSGATTPEARSVVVHAGSGRELEAVLHYCEQTQSTLMELATGSELLMREVGFPVVLCPNTNILMLKFMALLAQGGHHFKDYKIQLTESHQADKSSVPGTAVNLAHSLGLDAAQIVSVRDIAQQKDILSIPSEYLSRHAYHGVVIEDGLSSISIQTKVFGSAPYAEGVSKIIHAICANALEARRYNILEFVERGWL